MTIAGESGFLMENGASCLPCTPEEEKQIIKELMQKDSLTMKEGSFYYLLSNRWFMEWQKYTGQNADDFLVDKKNADSELSNGNYTTLGLGNFSIDEDSNGNSTCEDIDDSSKHEQFRGSQFSNGILSAPIARPGPIDNFDLVIDGSDSKGDDLELKRNLQERTDYILISQDVWKKLYDWYKGGPALPRKVISQGDFRKTFVVEVYPLCLQLTNARDDKKYVIRISKKASLQELYNMVKMLLGLEEEKFHIWDFFNKHKHSILAVGDQTLEETQLQMDQEILVEVEPLGFLPSGFGVDSTENGATLVAVEPLRFCPSGFGVDSTGNGLALVPVEPLRSPVSIAGGPTLSNGYSTGYMSNFSGGNSLLSPITDAEDSYNSRKMATGDKGLAGLQNLGNTCFMNSAIQCLVHTPPLAEYFLQDYSDEINKQNPIGLQGELAIAFGELLRKLWSSGRMPVPPRVFKGKLARFAPQFSGYNQHDSHELLAFLLDGLHEDLNRVKFKPYIEIKDANGRADEEVANECWDSHKARNNSVIVDVCQGQYKSTLVCPVCSKVSVTFDPFMYLSLPLPSTVTRSITVTVFYGDGRGYPSKVSVSVLKNGCYKDLFQAIGAACGLKSDESLLLAEVYQHRIYRYLENPFEQLSNIKNEDYIVAYRLPQKQDGYAKLELIHRSEEYGFNKKLVGTPLVTLVTEGPQNSEDIQSAVRMVLTPFLKIDKRPSNGVYTSTEAGSASGINVDGLVEAENHDCRPVKQPVDEMELDQLPKSVIPFNLSLIDDDKGTSCSPMGNASPFQPDHPTRVFLEWSNREYELYDMCYLEDLPVVYTTGFTSKKTRQEAISLFSCLETFLKEEPLGPDDMWYCPTCKEHRQATKKLDLWRLPEILVVHLKRFSYSRFLKNKLDTFVDFPIQNLDLRNYVKSKAADPQSHLYELYAVSNHYGGLGGGHYSAYAKLIKEENRWYHFDDSYVSPVREDEIKTSAAYVLFYQRVQDRGADLCSSSG